MILSNDGVQTLKEILDFMIKRGLDLCERVLTGLFQIRAGDTEKAVDLFGSIFWLRKAFDPDAYWFDQLKPAFGRKHFFFETAQDFWAVSTVA